MQKNKEVEEFLEQSNFIENERSKEALEDAIKAWEYAIKLEKIEIWDILEIHRILMNRINPEIAGRFRKVNVRVGSQICPNPGSVRRMLFQWIPDLNQSLYVMPFTDKEDFLDKISKKMPSPEEMCENLHIGFEKIHPFEDGNGRVGRIVWQWQRIKNGLPLKIIHADYPKENGGQDNYYKLFI